MHKSPITHSAALPVAVALLAWIGTNHTAFAQANVSIQIDTTKVIHTVPKNYHGSNFVALWNPTGNSPGTEAAFAQLGAKLLRFPGGVPAEFYDWEKPLQSGFTQITPENAYSLAKAGGAAMIFQTNAFNEKESTNKKTGEVYKWDNSGKHAADWVLHAKQAGMNVAFWEIGNEPEMDAPKDIKKNQDAVFKAYNDKFEEQARAIKQVDPGAKIMGPASTNTYFWWHEKNLEKFLKAEGNKGGTGLVDAVSLHWYPEGGNGSWEAKRGAAQEWARSMDYIRGVMKQYDSRPLPLYITEWNWGAGDKNDGAAKYANALGCADIIGMFLRTGVSGQTHFCLQHIGRNWGVIANKGDSQPENTVSPTFYALSIASHLGGGVLDTKNSVDEKNVLSAYATRDDADNVSVMLINKTDQPQQVTLAFQGYRPVTARVWTLLPAAGGVGDKDVIYNGQKTPSPATEKLPEPSRISGSALTAQKLPPFGLYLISFSAHPATAP